MGLSTSTTSKRYRRPGLEETEDSSTRVLGCEEKGHFGDILGIIRTAGARQYTKCTLIPIDQLLPQLCLVHVDLLPRRGPRPAAPARGAGRPGGGAAGRGGM